MDLLLVAVFLLFLLWVCAQKSITTLPRDLHLVYNAGRFMLYQKWLEVTNQTVISIFRTVTSKCPHKIAFKHLDDSWTFQKLDEESNRISRVLESEGLRKGDCVALMLDGRPEYVAIWLGVTKAGGVTSLINTNQTKHVLQRSIEICHAKYLVYGTNYTQAISDIVDELKVGLFHLGESTGMSIDGSQSLSQLSKEQSSKELKNHVEINQKDPILYIYTSGTTGLPKAAIITHTRFIMMVLGLRFILGIKDDDVIYTSLPLYHSAGGIIGVGQSILGSSTVAIRSKFSATNFFKDCIKYKCTVAQYIGEICRYILTTPESESDRGHSIRLMYGNGLRTQVWDQLVKRFGIKQIGEFYGATEGNASMVNAWNKMGAVGYIPWFVTKYYPVELILVDEETDEPVRDSNGLCIRCEAGQPGLLVGKILASRAASHFNGYVDKEATQKKIIENVFTKGDRCFNSGDILVKDDLGYMYFRDRKGDTFRWKGENVATTEVEGVISRLVGQKDSTVYGVEIPGAEGRAGMAAIVDPLREVELDRFYAIVEKELSSYARPVFVRIVEKLPFTGTFKIQKNQMQKEGFNPSKTSDPIYFLDSKLKKYIQLNPENYDQIMNNTIQL